MSEHEIQVRADPPLMTTEQAGRVLLQVEGMLRTMAEQMVSTNQRVLKLEKQLEQMTPVTTAQERALKDQVQQRAGELVRVNALPREALPVIAGEIRRSIKLCCGVKAMRELPRIEYLVHMERIALWDDYQTMKRIRERYK